MENLAIIIGRLGVDPELKYTTDGTAVANISVATSEKWYDKQDGEKRESVQWHRVQVWRKLGESCAKHLKKGSLVYIRGKLNTTQWETEGGDKRYSTQIVAKKVTFL